MLPDLTEFYIFNAHPEKKQKRNYVEQFLQNSTFTAQNAVHRHSQQNDIDHAVHWTYRKCAESGRHGGMYTYCLHWE